MPRHPGVYAVPARNGTAAALHPRAEAGRKPRSRSANLRGQQVRGSRGQIPLGKLEKIETGAYFTGRVLSELACFASASITSQIRSPAGYSLSLTYTAHHAPKTANFFHPTFSPR